jgi:hypothetical protein
VCPPLPIFTLFSRVASLRPCEEPVLSLPRSSRSLELVWPPVILALSSRSLELVWPPVVILALSSRSLELVWPPVVILALSSRSLELVCPPVRILARSTSSVRTSTTAPGPRTARCSSDLPPVCPAPRTARSSIASVSASRFVSKIISLTAFAGIRSSGSRLETYEAS